MAVGFDSGQLTDGGAGTRSRWAAVLVPIRFVWRIVTFGGFSSLTRRIVLLNLVALGALVTGILVLNQSRDSLIGAKIQSLTTQGYLIAQAISASATIDLAPTVPRLDPNLMLDLEAGGAAMDVFQRPIVGLDFPIDPEQAQIIFNYLAVENGPRLRIYQTDGSLLLDSDNLRIARYDLPPIGAGEPGFFEQIWNGITAWFRRSDLPLYVEAAGNASAYPEVATAITGQSDTVTRVTSDGQLIVSVAVPISGYASVQGALLLTTQPGDIDAVMRGERNAILRVFAVAALVSVILSFLLAGTIAAPLRRLAAAADSVRAGVKSRPEIPDFSRRGDEVGHLSQALRDMTTALYNRIDAIESFAADVAHELKNPLTSLRSAVETMPLAKTAESQKRLSGIIQHDVRRLDRLISDIADASRLDAELARRDSEAVSITRLLDTIVAIANDTSKPGQPTFVLVVEDSDDAGAFTVMGHDTRLGQVFTNLLDNARSFSPSGTVVTVMARRDGDTVEVVVEDEGPGINADNVDRIFERFYTDRPDGESFGQNSGLGLSISKQIVEAHKGRIWAENILRHGVAGHPAGIAGARFVVRLPGAA
ncbi:MAG: sensor histidine kinase [Bauldia sp.]|nr:sensor histidine kinase [Bauldia sp.]MCW5716826.1 sensor histidine kinase [Bauldia sp.]